MVGLHNEFDRYNRLLNLVSFAGGSLCKDLLFKTENWPTDGRLLYKYMEPLRSKFVAKAQRDVLFPPSGVTDINQCDLTLLTTIIQLSFGNKYGSLVRDVRKMRNILVHKGDMKLSKVEFDEIWKNYTGILRKHGFDVTMLNELKPEDNIIYITQGIMKYTFQYNYYISEFLLFHISHLLFFS